ncbi:unnamed protein product [Heligmosomoides polygyrus]|uniref:Reverse transcriptase domain-containing protein n=1 Tax=Heligmosomoides polygyrus TaxID=6339 RepID=A0A183FPQ6_HELPZ|nr:unnamed protein product [Heligmosomoides polygyrus]
MVLENFLFLPNSTVFLSETDREEYTMAEKIVSRLTRKSTAALLNSTGKKDIFRGLLNNIEVVIGDEASQILEPVFVAVANSLSDTRHIYIGDARQLAPHIRCPRTASPAQYGARGVTDLPVPKEAVPVASLCTTYRAHPQLNKLPSSLFYANTLVSGTSACDRRLFLDNVRCRKENIPVLYVNVSGTSLKSAIITFYKDQFRRLEQFTHAVDVDLHTVDSVQGRQCAAGLLDDALRMNVALARSRHGTFVLLAQNHSEPSRTGPESWDGPRTTNFWFPLPPSPTVSNKPRKPPHRSPSAWIPWRPDFVHERPAPWTLLYADDVMLACEEKIELQRQVQDWCSRLEKFGFKLNVKKTEYMTTDEDESSSIKVNGIQLPHTSVFKYLGSVIATDGGLLITSDLAPFAPQCEL